MYDLPRDPTLFVLEERPDTLLVFKSDLVFPANYLKKQFVFGT